MLTRRNIVARAAAALALPFARTAEASAFDGELPPLPRPTDPPEEIIKALIAWIGDEEALIQELRGGVDSAVEQHCADDDHYRMEPLFKALDRWPFDDDGHGEKIRRAIVRYGYNRLPLPAWLADSSERADAQAEASPIDDDQQWADKQIAALMAEFIATEGSTRLGKLALAKDLAGNVLFRYEGLVSDEDYESHKSRLDAIEEEANRRMTGKDLD